MNNLFEFIRVDTFLDDINREDCFDTRDMDGISKNYRIILVSECPLDINDCLDEDGTLITPYDAENGKGVNIITTEGDDDGFVSLLWSKGINGERTISLSDSLVTYDFGSETVQVKGAFLVNTVNGTGYVLAYGINNKTVTLDGTFISPVNGMIWAMRYDE